MTTTGKVLAITIWSFVLLIIVLICSLIVYIKIDGVVLDEKEKHITKSFSEEVSNTQGLTVTWFTTNDGVGITEIEIKGKGKVSLMYNNPGNFSLQRIGTYPLTFPCVSLKQNKRISYGGEDTTSLIKGSPYLQWFPEVNSLQELVDKYDQIIVAVERLPKNPQLREYRDFFWPGKRFTLAYPDERFRVYHERRHFFSLFNERIACDLFTGPQYIPEK